MKRLFKLFPIVCILLPVLMLGGCLEEVVLSIEAEGDMSMLFADSRNIYIWGDGKPYNADDSLKPELFTLVNGVVDVAAGTDFALWFAADGLYGTGVEDGMPFGTFSGEKLEIPHKIVTIGTEVVSSDGDKFNITIIDEDLSTVTQIAAGETHTLLLKADGTVWAWGMNALGQLGQGTTGIAIRTPVRVGSLEAVQSIATGRMGCSAALDMNGHVWCWGGDNPTPTVIEGLPDRIAEIEAGDEFWLALDGDYNVWTWSVSDMTPRKVDGLPPVWTIEVGDRFAMAVDNDKNLWTWGDNAHGQLARDTGGQRDDTPVKVTSLGNVISVSAGSRHAMAVRSDGSVWLWGANDHGQLGNGTTDDSAVPLKLGKLTTRVG